MNKPYTKKNPIKNSYARPDAEIDLGDNIKLKARFWLEKDGETFLASGRIDLLNSLSEAGSITTAAEKLGISYHHAWTLIDKMNKLAKNPLIKTTQGGKSGGGSELTDKAKYLIEQFEKVQKDFKEAVQKMSTRFE